MSADKQNDLQRILQDGKAGIYRVSGTGGILAELLRRIWLNNKFTLQSLENLLEDFVRLARKETESHSLKKSLNKGNLRRLLGSPKLTWRSFVTALRVLRVVKFEISITLYFRGRSTPAEPVKVVVDLGMLGQDEADDSDEE